MLIFIYAGCQTTPKAEDTAAAEGGGISVVSLYAGLTGASDSIPSPDGNTLYFTIDQGEPGIWTAPYDGSGTPERVAELTAPKNLVTDEDGDTIYATDGGGIYSMDAAGGMPTLVIGTVEHSPLGIDLLHIESLDWLYYTGFSGVDPAVFRIPVSGGTAELLASGSPLVEPTGIVTDETGRVFVCDEAAGADGRAALLEVSEGAATVMAEGFEGGTPCGVALTPDDTTVMISSVDDSGHSQVVLVNAETAEVSTFNDVINVNTGSGGLHRQEGMRLRSTTSPTHYAWMDRSNNNGRQIYDVTFE